MNPQKEFNTALAALTPEQRATYMTKSPLVNVGGVQQMPSNGGYAPVITPESLQPGKPLVLPQPNPTGSLYNPQISTPTGSVLDASGNATIPKNETSDTTAFIKEQFKSLGSELDKKSQFTEDAQLDTQLANKTERAVNDFNNYNRAKLAYQQQIDAMYDKAGGTTAGTSSAISDFSRRANADLANLAIQAQVSQGLETAARQTIKDKVEAQFQPIQEKIDYLVKFSQLNANDLTESEKMKLTELQNQKKTDLANVQKVSGDLHQAVLDNGNPPGVLAALDKVTDDFISGKITAQEAQNKMFAAAGQYGGDVLGRQIRQAQLDKLNADNAKTIAETKALGGGGITNPDATKYASALSTILGSDKFTKEQKADVINAVNNGEDPFAVVKNQAKNIMGQTLSTQLDKYETAKAQMENIDALLDTYYANGGTTSIFKGNYEKSINKLGGVTDPKLVEIATNIASALQIYRNAVSGTAYSVQEGKDIASIFPGINKSEGLNKAILSGRMNAFDTTIDAQYRNTLGKTYDDLKKSVQNDTKANDPLNLGVGNSKSINPLGI